MVKYPIHISKKFFWKELNISRGVVKHPIYIYITKKVVRKELNTSGGVVKHPISEKRLFGPILSLRENI